MKPKYLFHGSTTPDLKTLKPRKRYTPKSLGDKAKPSIYATSNQAYAAGHVFPWKSEEGFDLYDNEGTITLEVPKKLASRLDQPIYIYNVLSEKFNLLEADTPNSSIYITHSNVNVISVESFKNVKEAIELHGGKILFVN